MTIQTIVIEDEAKSMHVICDLIEQFTTDLALIGTADSVEKSVRLIESRSPHLVVLDIQIADGTGFDVLRKLSYRNFELICITAYDNYAVEAFRFSAIDYLLKPIGIPEFKEAVDRARKRIMEKDKQQQIDALLYNLSLQNTQDRKIGIATLSGCEFVDLKEIIWCNADGNYTTFHLANNVKLISSRHLGSYEGLLCANNFFRIHNTSIINLRFIKSYVKGKNGYVIMANGARLEIAQRRKGDFLDRF